MSVPYDINRDVPQAPSHAWTEHEQQEKSHPLNFNREEDARALLRAQFAQTYIPLDAGRVLLRLREPLWVQYHPGDFTVEVEGWHIRVPWSEAPRLPRELARTFLTLFAKAETENLTEEEAATWLAIVDKVDYADFSVRRALPRYLQGTLLRHHPQCRVEWLDGKTEVISPQAAPALSIVNPGERFSAMVKFDRHGKASALESVGLVPDTPTIPDESWPRTTSS